MLGRKSAVSHLSAIALGLIVGIIVVFGAYISLSLSSGSTTASVSSLPDQGSTTGLGTTQLGVTVMTTCWPCNSTTTFYIPPATMTSSNFGNSSLTYTNTSYVGETFKYSTMPTSFRIGDYNFAMIYNGTGYYYTANGTFYTNSGFDLVLNVTSLQNGNSKIVVFGWAPPAPQPYTLPAPSTASLFSGVVQMQWYSNTTGISGVFLTISIVND